MKKLIILIIALILLVITTYIIYAQETCTYTGPYADLINKHIQRQSDDGGITEQCSQGQILTKECGYCGNRIKQCNNLIWDVLWSDCQGQGYCDPAQAIPDVLLKDTYRKENYCLDNKVEYVKTYERKECGNDCAYTNIQELDEHIAWACNTGYCNAECSASTNEKCGRCGTLSCNNCKEACVEPAGACTPGTKRINLGCSGSCEIKEDTCSDNCGWIEGTCSEPEYESENCNEELEIGTKKQCGYCGTQTCNKRCDFSTKKGKAIYYWSSCENEYNGNDKCLPNEIKEKEKEKDRILCEGALTKKVDVYQNKICPNTCKLDEGAWTGNEILKNERKVAIKGQCGYECDNGETIPMGSDTGECQKGIKECRNNQWVITQNEIHPSTEVCDSLDNNCNGETDEGCNTVPYTPSPQPNVDINDDGQINQFDFRAFYEANGKCKNNPGYNVRADFNRDDCIGNEGKEGGSESQDSSLFKEKFLAGGNYLRFCTRCPDIVEDGIIDLKDVLQVILNNPKADLDGNGIIASMSDLGDIMCITSYYGVGIPSTCKTLSCPRPSITSTPGCHDLGHPPKNAIQTSGIGCSTGQACYKCNADTGYYWYIAGQEYGYYGNYSRSTNDWDGTCCNNEWACVYDHNCYPMGSIHPTMNDNMCEMRIWRKCAPYYSGHSIGQKTCKLTERGWQWV